MSARPVTRRVDMLLFGLVLGFTAGMAAMAVAPQAPGGVPAPAPPPTALPSRSPQAPSRREDEGPRLRLGFSFDPPPRRARECAPQVWSARDIGDDLVALAADIRDAKA